MAQRCSHTIADVSFGTTPTVAAAPKIRASKVGRWRALSLLFVHVLVAIHVAHWWANGSTLTPLEPSEGMEFGANGVVNAGLVFFALAIVSTLFLGRWFCGWACHVVALQDGCSWLLAKVGIKPRPVDLGLLGVVPWLAFAYMFLAPVASRVVTGAPLGVQSWQLYRSDFWGTFPPWPVAIVTLAACGPLIVWMLGAKAFCTYGCPYGGIFGVVDQLAPVRIRVTDACDACGHCTAVCTSKVRVHQEVRDWKAVVDPGCMKCMDCVSVCPKDALYVGIGAPALFAKRRAGTGARPAGLLRWALLAVFLFASLAVFELTGSATPFDSTVDVQVIAILGLLSLAVVVVFRGRSERTSGYALWEEALLAGLFLSALFAFRGLHEWVPFLFGLALSAMLAYLVVQGLRLLYRPDVAVLGRSLRRAGRLTGAGTLMLAGLLPLGTAWWYGASVRLDRLAAVRHYDGGVAEAERGEIDAAIASFRAALARDDSLVEARENLAGMLCQAGRFDEGIAEYQRALVSRPDDLGTRVFLARAFAAKGDLASARAELERVLGADPRALDAHALLAEICRVQGDTACAAEHERIARELAAKEASHAH